MPGQEMFKTIEYGLNNNIQTEFLGGFYNSINFKEIKLETRLNFI